MSPSRIQPALLGGVAIGVLSALPFISIGNCCCCAWILFGGALAAYLMQQNHPAPINVGDGAIVGLIAGVIGAVIWLVLTIPISVAMAPMQLRMTQRVLQNAADLPPELRTFFESMSGGATIGMGLVFSFFLMLIASSLFGMLGGLFGALMFRKVDSPVVPPPIPPMDAV